MAIQKAPHVDDLVGSRLREARESAGLSQGALARGACTAAYVSRVELGERTPSLQLLRQLGKRLGLSADYLATGRLSGHAEEETPLAEAEVALRLDEIDEAQRLFVAALAESTDARTRAAALAGLGQVALRGDRYRDAIELLSEAAQTGDEDVLERPALAESLARAYAAVGEFSPAIALLERCVEHFERSGDILQYVKFAALLGYALTDNGEFGRAELVVAGALARGHGVVDPYARARLYWSQSRLLAEQGKSAAAERYARRTLETLRATEDSYAVAHALETLAHICVELGRNGEALELLDEGEPLIRGAGSPSEIAHFALERARALAALGERDAAASLAMEVAGRLAETQPVGRGRAYLLLADLFRELDEPARAEELYELAIDTTGEQAPGRYLVAAYRGLAELRKAQGDRDAALELLERAVSIQAGAATPSPVPG